MGTMGILIFNLNHKNLICISRSQLLRQIKYILLVLLLERIFKIVWGRTLVDIHTDLCLPDRGGVGFS
jgi:hypothetical protein